MGKSSEYQYSNLKIALEKFDDRERELALRDCPIGEQKQLSRNIAGRLGISGNAAKGAIYSYRRWMQEKAEREAILED